MPQTDEDEGILVRRRCTFLTDAAREHIKTVCHHVHNEQSTECLVAIVRVMSVILLWQRFLIDVSKTDSTFIVA